MSAPRQAGFTLVELMVSVVLVGVVTSLSVRLASTVIDAYREQRIAMAIQRAARASIDLVSDAVRNASAGVATGDARDAAGCSDVVGIDVVNRSDGPDQISVIYASGGIVTSLRSSVTAASSRFTVTSGDGLAVGDRVLITDGTSGRLLPVNRIEPSGADVEIRTVAAGVGCPGVPMPADGYRAGALVVRARASTFYIATAAGVPTLMLDPDGTGPEVAEPLAEGIEDMQIAVGVDLDGDGALREDGSTSDEWFYNAAGDLDPPAVTTTRWRAVRVTVVARTTQERQPTTTSLRPALEDRPAGIPDPYRRRVLSTVVEIRNLEGSP
jgi:prepilin-type N-terminal cleavage/methylation domain-containing protein